MQFLCAPCSCKCTLLQETAQHRLADYHARDAAGAWMVLACQAMAVTGDEALLEEVCRLPGELLQAGLCIDEGIVRAALVCIASAPTATRDHLQALLESM